MSDEKYEKKIRRKKMTENAQYSIKSPDHPIF